MKPWVQREWERDFVQGASEGSCPACRGGVTGCKAKWEMHSTAPWWRWQAGGNGRAVPAHIPRPRGNPAEGS